MVESFDNFAQLRKLKKAFKKSSKKQFFRLNVVVSGSETRDQVRAFVQKTMDPEVFSCLNFRGDYTKTDQTTLNSADDPFFKTLMGMADFEPLGHNGCLVCRSDAFKTKKGTIVYHRGIAETSLLFSGELHGKNGRHATLVVNDFVVKQDGELRYDWNAGAVVTKELARAFGIA